MLKTRKITIKHKCLGVLKTRGRNGDREHLRTDINKCSGGDYH